MDRKKSSRVPIAAILQIEHLASLVKTCRSGGHSVFRTGLHELFPLGVGASLALVLRFEQYLPAVGRKVKRKTNTEIVVGHISSNAFVSLDQLTLARFDVHTIHIV